MTQTQRPPTLIPSVIAPAIQTGISASQSLSERLWRRFATLGGRFRTLIIVIIVLTCLTALTVSLSSSRAAGDLSAIGSVSIPSISAAQKIVPYLEDIDARAADYLANTSATPQPCVNSLTGQQMGQFSAHDCANQIIDSDQQALNHQLFLAGQNTAFPGSQTALQQTQNGLETYIGDINLMRHEYSLATPGNPSDPHLLQAYQAERSAQTILLQQLAGRVANEPALPSCTLNGQTLSPQAWPNAGIETNMLCLSALGKPRLDSAYNDNVSFFGVSLGLVFGLSIYCCIFLFWSTWSMVSTTRKLFQPALILALLVALVSTSVVLADFDAIYGHNGYFSVIANDYNNVYTVGTLEQEGAQVQADQARWLAALIFHDATSANQQWYPNGQARSQQVTSSLQQFVASQHAAQNAPLLAKIQQDWNSYNAQVKAVNQLSLSSGSTVVLSRAENLHLSQASAAFQTFTSAIQQFSTANTNDYQSILNEASARLAALTTWWAIIFPILGVLGAWGISRRLKDF